MIATEKDTPRHVGARYPLAVPSYNREGSADGDSRSCGIEWRAMLDGSGTSLISNGGVVLGLRATPRGHVTPRNWSTILATITSRSGIAWIECAKLRRFPGLVHAFSTRRGGAIRSPSSGLNLGYNAGDRRANVEANRLRFFNAVGAGRFSVASLRQIHSDSIYQVRQTESGHLRYTPAATPSESTIDDCRLKAPRPQSTIGNRQSPNAEAGPPGDALMTGSASVLLSIRTADCMPILLADPRRRAVAAIHAGWRGALASIIEKTVREMRQAFSSQPEDLVAAIGPSIRVCCYEVGQEVADAFRSRFRASAEFFAEPPSDAAAQGPELRYPRLPVTAAPAGRERGPGSHLHLDLTAVARRQLREAGVAPSKIEVTDYCTACHTELFFSHRKEGTRAGRMMAVIGIKP